MSVNTLLATPYGPTTTLARNTGTLGALLLGLSCVVAPPLQGVPLSRSAYFAAVGALLIGLFIFHLFRWKGVLRRALRDAKETGARDVASFMQARVVHAKSRETDSSGAGWLSVMDDRIVIRYRHTLAGGVLNGAKREVLFRHVVSISRSDTTSISYTALIISTSTEEQLFFTLAPQSGSGWQGPSEEQTVDVVRRVQEVIHEQT